MTTALILAGHGSHITPATAGVVWKHVDALRKLAVADEVTAAFWKEMPSFHTVVNTLVSDDITIVPLFTAQGYFTRTVIPAEMDLNNGALPGRLLRYSRTLSEHPYLGAIVRQRIEDTLRKTGLRPSETAVAIIGHGTKRDPDSRRATEAQAETIRDASIAAEVVALYLDDTPSIPDVYTLTRASAIIAVPYFLAPGSHTTLDVPQALGLTPGASTGNIQGRTVYYTPPIGTEDSLPEVILELAREAGAPLRPPTISSAWNSFPVAGRERLLNTVAQEGELVFGQLRLTSQQIMVDGDLVPYETIMDPAALRTRLRENPFRPLATSSDLPGGWRVPISAPDMLHAVVETVYPGAVAYWDAQCRGTLDTQSLADVAARQTGMFRQLADFQHTDILVVAVCDHCVLYPAWLSGSQSVGMFPCAEPCNFWMSRALEAKE